MELRGIGHNPLGELVGNLPTRVGNGNPGFQLVSNYLPTSSQLVRNFFGLPLPTPDRSITT